MNFTVRPLDQQAARIVASWRYPPPYNIYNFSDNPAELALFLSVLDGNYYRLEDAQGGLVAFCCYGREAQVPGGDYRAPALDIGIGVRPDLIGRGAGMQYLAPVLTFALDSFSPPALRLSVAAFNQRAIRLYERAGFVLSGRFTSLFSQREFLLMWRAHSPPAAAEALPQ